MKKLRLIEDIRIERLIVIEKLSELQEARDQDVRPTFEEINLLATLEVWDNTLKFLNKGK